jgi:hypothetical protein
MTIFGVRVWRFVLMVLAAEIAPILVLVLAMFFVGTAQGAQPSQETASAWGSWIGPTFGALFTGFFAYRLARGSNRPGMFGLAFGVSVAMLDLGLTLGAAQGLPFQWLFALSALSRLASGGIGGWMADRRARAAA